LTASVEAVQCAASRPAFGGARRSARPTNDARKERIVGLLNRCLPAASRRNAPAHASAVPQHAREWRRSAPGDRQGAGGESLLR